MTTTVRVSGALVSVERNRYGKPGQAWMVRCALCGEPDLLGLFGGKKVLGVSPEWRLAQDYAVRHALEHEATRCTTCLHVPEAPVASTPVRTPA